MEYVMLEWDMVEIKPALSKFLIEGDFTDVKWGICEEEIDTEYAIELPCLHKFHVTCANKKFKGRCPSCGKRLIKLC